MTNPSTAHFVQLSFPASFWLPSSVPISSLEPPRLPLSLFETSLEFTYRCHVQKWRISQEDVEVAQANTGRKEGTARSTLPKDAQDAQDAQDAKGK